MKKLFIASNNAHKIDEIETILRQNGVDMEVTCPKEMDCHEEPEENGQTFEENAYIKAKFYYDLFHLPTIADDSGICIDYFDGGPGIYSARFLAELDYDKKCDRIIEMMKDTDDRGAQFVDCMCFIEENGNVSYYTGTNEGYIAREKAGHEGFGYDPIFVIPEYNKTEAELGMVYKNEHSHRAKALKKWILDAKEKL
ncbi:MAG: RdgB/HAM1 family non-canonical purine NTP pyrophosphatase [Erysipelotrichaceae bacterium]|nr:RdgB/HAM1 family non-canonical purine NTP pyrophosphatase [Erysipelotrichaceae bacterium]